MKKNPNEGAAALSDAKESKRRTLHELAKDGDCGALAEALKNGADPAARDPLGWTPLMEAARAGRVECVRLLAPIGEARATLADGIDALIMAASAGEAECARILLPLSDTRNTDKDDWSALTHAVAAGAVECVALLRDVCDARAGTDTGLTPLMVAAMVGSARSVELLLPVSDHGRRDNDGLSALEHAAGSGKSEPVRLLLPTGNPLWQAEDGRTALIMAAIADCKGAVELLLPVSDARARMPDNRAAISFAAASHLHTGCVEALISASDPEAITEALGWAAARGVIENIRALAEAGGDPHARDNQGDDNADGYTAFDWAGALPGGKAEAALSVLREAMARKERATIDQSLKAAAEAGRLADGGVDGATGQKEPPRRPPRAL
jgi:ankyrin repeat protein